MEGESYECKSGDISTIKNSFTCAAGILIYAIKCTWWQTNYIGHLMKRTNACNLNWYKSKTSLKL